MERDTFGKITVGFCYGILIFFMFTIMLRIFVRVVLVERLQMSSPYINALFFDQQQLSDTENGGLFRMDEDGNNTADPNASIDWEERYPFSYEEEEESISGIAPKWQEKAAAWELAVTSITKKISAYATDYLIGQEYFAGAMNQIKALAGWNLTGYQNYNDVATLEDGRLTEYLPKWDVEEHAQSVQELKVFLDMIGCRFLYIQSPYAICKYENARESGTFDFSNQNADQLLEKLRDLNIECLDMRELLHEDGLSHADAFYRTDHHWKAETGLWAAGRLAQYLNEAHGFAIDASMLSEEKFDSVVYPQWWLGSRGTKLTIKAVEPEDFTMLYPKYETKLHYQVPSCQIDETGDFSITYDMECVATEGGYSEDNHYGVYNHSDRPVQILHNEKSEGKRILIIKDSFVNVVSPFLACAEGVSEIDLLDVRHFTGSAKAFIQEKNPDIVIVWYNPSSIHEINWPTHASTFDFR